MGQPNIDPLTSVGSYVSASDWNELIADPNVTVIDRETIAFPSVPLKGRSTQTDSFHNFPIGSKKPRPSQASKNRDVLHRWHSVRKQPPIFCKKGSKKCLTLKAAFQIPRRRPRTRQPGTGNASSSIKESRWVTA